MRKSTVQLFLIFFLLASCGQRTRAEQYPGNDSQTNLSKPEQAFLDNLAGLCGKSFGGEQTYIEPGRESWAHKKFVMHVTVCEPGKVLIPFHLDDDHSRTWMFLADENGLRFRHDHRHEDGNPEELNLYGGYADGSGTAFVQRFPSDDYTLAMLDDDYHRQWNIILAEDLSNMKYQLFYRGELIFEARFDLNNPL